MAKKKSLHTTHNLRVRVCQRDGTWCCVCGEEDPRKLTLDHIVKRAFGGTDDLNNLQILCLLCHRYKDGYSDRMVFTKRTNAQLIEQCAIRHQLIFNVRQVDGMVRVKDILRLLGN